jgi:ankyrin repeat protein
MQGSIQVLDILQQHPAWKKLVYTRTKTGSTPLHIAAYRDHSAVVTWLCNAVPDLLQIPESMDSPTILHCAALFEAFFSEFIKFSLFFSLYIYMYFNSFHHSLRGKKLIQ